MSERADGAARFGIAPRFEFRPLGRLETTWVLFTLSIGCFSVATLAAGRLGALGAFLETCGGASCGWSWLLSRALYRPAKSQGLWPDIVVGALLATGAVLTNVGDAPDSGLLRVIHNANALISSTVLFLALIEPLQGLGASGDSERRFRLAFVTAYGALLLIAVLYVGQAPAGSAAAHWAGAIKVACGCGGVAIASAAVLYRQRHPQAARPARRSAAATDQALADEIMRALRDDDAYATADLRVSDLARKVRRPEYQVTQCITGALGAANFNQLLNRMRIEAAKAQLADPAEAPRSILDIALGCGFGSIGPFNRAFKAETGLTPSAFRSARR